MPEGREIRLAAHPNGRLRPSDFAVAVGTVPDPTAGQVLVRNTWVSVDPALRLRLDGRDTYLPAFAVGDVLDGAAIGEVLVSKADWLRPGDVVAHRAGWRELAVLDAPAPGIVRRVDVSDVPPQVHLGALGHTGFSAFVGLFAVAGLRDDDVVYVSAAAGAVGGLAGQMARNAGHRVIGSAGSAVKATHMREELGLDSAFDYHDGPVADALRRLAPDGIDVYFDNVGGEHLDAAIGALRPHGRVAVCGTVSSYGSGGRAPGLANEFQLVAKRLRIQGFLVADHMPRWPEFEVLMKGWLRTGAIVQYETIFDGLEKLPEAFITLLSGGALGKTLVRVG